jgi:hypothetical protein
MPTIVAILRDLWHLRLAVLVVFLVAALVGVAVAFRVSFPPSLESRKYEVGVATVRVLVDTPTPQVVGVAPKGSETLVPRATLLASLMVDGVVNDAIARRADLRPAQLQSSSTVAAEEQAPERPGPRDYALTTRVLSSGGGDPLPIIEIEAQSPTAPAAKRLANAAVAGLRDYLDSQAADTSATRRLQVGGLGTAQAGTVVRGTGGMMGVAVTLLLFAGGCAVLLVIRALARDWRAGAGYDQASLMDIGLAADQHESPEIAGEPPPDRPGEARDQFDDYWLTPQPVPAPADGRASARGHAA